MKISDKNRNLEQLKDWRLNHFDENYDVVFLVYAYQLVKDIVEKLNICLTNKIVLSNYNKDKGEFVAVSSNLSGIVFNFGNAKTDKSPSFVISNQKEIATYSFNTVGLMFEIVYRNLVFVSNVLNGKSIREK